MKAQAVLLALLLLTIAGAGVAADPNAMVIGPGHGVVIDNPTPDEICAGSTLKDNTDGSYENGYAWAYDGVAPPYYGAFVEGFSLSSGDGTVCGMRFAFTETVDYGRLMDVYVWDASGSNPNNVLSVTTGVNPGTIGIWPVVTQHDIDINDIQVPNDYFVGYWGDWPGSGVAWFVAADENGVGGGLPRTDIAPGMGFPSGWQHPNVVSPFSNCQDLGIAVYEAPCFPGAPGACCLPDGSCEVMQIQICAEHGGTWHFCQDCSPGLCPPVPVDKTSWGRIKRTFD